MAYTTPKTWTNEPLLASDLNTHLRDNMNEIKDPPTAQSFADEVSHYTTTSTSFVDIDATEGKFQHTIVTNGGDVLVWASLSGEHNGTSQVFFDVDVDGVTQGGTDGLKTVKSTGAAERGGTSCSFAFFVEGLSAGSHVFKLQWYTNSGTATIYAGDGSSLEDVHSIFGVREVS